MQALSQLSYTPNEAAHYRDSPEACKGSVWEKLAGVEQRMRVELLFDAAHDGKGRGVDLQGKKAALFGADAVFAGKGAAQLQHLVHDPVMAGMSARHFIRIVGVHHEVDMQVAIAGMAEGHHGQMVCAQPVSSEKFDKVRQP